MIKLTRIFIFPIILGLFLSASDIRSIRNQKDLSLFVKKKFHKNIDEILGEICFATFNYNYHKKKLQNKIIKIDLDGNGKLDLLLEQTEIIFAIFDEGNNKYKLYPISEQNFYLSKIIKISHEAKLPVIYEKIYGVNFPFQNSITKKIIFKNGSFIEFNPNPKKYKVDKIDFSVSNGLSMYNLKININSNREVNLYQVNHLSQIEKKARFVLDEKSYNEIIELLNYIDFTNLKSSYTVFSTDNSYGDLTIKYNNSKVKKISDYGMTGSIGLSKFYNLISSLSERYKWQKIKVIKHKEPLLESPKDIFNLTGIISGNKPTVIININNESKILRVGDYFYGINKYSLLSIDLNKNIVFIKDDKNQTYELKFSN
ncbi:MAG: DUF6438 domain-containing protein [Candidatus Sericytochromatia bacterium]